MSSRSPKDLIKSKWGSKPSNSKSETALEKFRGKTAALQASMDEFTSGKGKLTDKERHRLLEKIRILEAEREKNAYQLTEKDKEMQRLRDQLKARYSTTALLEQLEEKTKEGERREQLLKSLSEETDVLKRQLSTTTARLAELESKASTLRLSQTVATSCFNSSMSNIHEMEIQLKDALEKNQQWLVYDQQREVYVKGLLAKIYELEQKSETAAHSLSQQTKKTESEGLQEEKQKYYNHLLANAKKDLEVERQTITQLNFELNEFRRKYEETQKEVQDLNKLLCSQRKADVQHLEDDRHKTEKIQRLKEENDVAREKLEEEKKRSKELLSQVQFLYTSLLKQQEEQTRVALLEQQMQACTLDFENEKLDRQNMQHQLHVILKELRKARNQITQLESLKQLRELAFTEPLVTFQGEAENKGKVASPKSPTAALNESLVECPKCNIQYPATEHRDLLVHVEYCSK
ncbi:centrosomal protein of 55 kDa isoform X1 [Pteropus medius]|uniref:Centrosomal protein of 55 kDa n=2 Tax=Pteropus vampyrus TaxID=132908 RepID=A0A6P3Q6E0_PTEVA|nr:centrosomal protein of 55 kDa isoform X1 [Pteropus vampyrus]XP_011359861.1 centrosomal protein of 55 kDa isoform X1 [Pteropus vampyrus]XP_039727652.1 centrosomal protein of 55 kDa isoform X1 [Pteropus giganteus]XP_039727653.1 centrosomal protein of 55 kDa isoform X1 [Pteropus giganteus]